MDHNFSFLLIVRAFSRSRWLFDQESAMGELYQRERSERDWRFPCRLGGVIPVIISALPIDSKNLRDKSRSVHINCDNESDVVVLMRTMLTSHIHVTCLCE